MLLISCIAALLAAALLESALLAAARRAVTIRIHVNGTRGKSTVTRMIWGALHAAGCPAVAKTTGTEPRLLLPDGSERRLRRCGRVNIREQVRTLLLARKAGARALVVECMAVQPELQWVTEHRILRSTVGVITNVRLDHTEAMGHSLPEIAASLANTVPHRAVLVLGETPLAGVFESRASAQGTRVVACPPGSSGWLESDRAVALAVARELGIPDEIALEGIARFPPDPGAASVSRSELGNLSIDWLDARAANDGESLRRILCEHEPAFSPGSTLAIYNHRSDRPRRLLDFACAHFGLNERSAIWITGERPPWSLWRTIRRLHAGELRFVCSEDLGPTLGAGAPSFRGVVFCGNTRGLTPRLVLGRICHD